jgi:hypothetical protein
VRKVRGEDHQSSASGHLQVRDSLEDRKDYQQMTPREFGELYWANKHPEVRKLRTMAAPDKDSIEMIPLRQEAALELAQQGHTIDALIDIQFADIDSAPWTIMQQRLAWGYTWYPSLLQATPTIAPGLSQPGTAPYDPMRPPPGSIKVSVDAADYPPFELPTKPPTDPTINPVGGEIFPGFGLGKFHSAAGDTWPLGSRWVDRSQKKEYVKKGTATPFGSSVWWELAS